MATDTTTWGAIATKQISTVRGLTPTSLASYRFTQLDPDIENFEEWATANPNAVMRRFEISDTTEWEPPEVWDLNIRRVNGASQIRIAYPRTLTALYGANHLQGAYDVINQDLAAITSALMKPANYLDGQHTCLVASRVFGDEGSPIFLAEVDCSFTYNLSTS